MLRMVFTPADLGRIRVARGWHPMWETVLSINSLQSRNLPGRLSGWRDGVRADARREHGVHRLVRAAATLVPASGNFPDFLTPHLSAAESGAHYDDILALPRKAVRADLERTFRQVAAPDWARQMHGTGRTDSVVRVLRGYHDLAVKWVSQDISRQVETERARYSRLLCDEGAEGLLSGVHPSIRWSSPVLEAEYPHEVTIDLDGRGLLLIPAHFCWGAPVTFIDGERTPVLVCPSEAAADGVPAVGERAPALARLLGETRARLLGELAIAGSTTELADRLGLSLAAISQHTKILREAGLVDTRRTGQSVVHMRTPLGRLLADG